MFGSVRRKSSNVRAMQLFHELKQQFPTLPDHVVSACIANHAHKSDKKDLRETLEVAVAQQEPMGRTLTETSETALIPIPSHPEDIQNSDREVNLTAITSNTTTSSEQTEIVSPLPAAAPTPPPKPTVVEIPKPERRRRRKKFSKNAMDNKDQSDKGVISSVHYDKNSESVESNPVESTVKVGNSSFFVKRPNTLNLSNVNETSDRSFNNIQPSGRCSDVHKLLNSEVVNSKPPRSPLSTKRFNHKNSPTKGSPRSPSVEASGARSPSDQSESKKTEPKTVETPTQTTDTLLGNCGGGGVGGGGGGGGGGLPTTSSNSAGVNVSLNVNCSVDVVQSPTRSKCTTSLQVVPQQPWCQEVISPKSYTSVNLTLRPPSSAPQPPIDITSQNSCLTYSTSSFDPQKGLQSRLQITVGPSGGGVSSMRTRPRSSYHPDNQAPDLIQSNRSGSLPDLTDKNKSVINEQQVRINKLKIELRTEKGRLIAMQKEVEELENSENEAEKEKYLQKEIIELQEECKKLTIEVDNRCGSAALPLGETRARFYDNIYTGQRPALSLGFPTEHITSNRGQRTFTYQSQPINSEIDGPKWNCHMCTFQNHPLLDRCEQCEMPRILHGKKQDQQLSSRTDYASNYPGLNNNNNSYRSGYHPDRQFLTQYSTGALPYGAARPNAYMNQYSCPSRIALSPRTPTSTGLFANNNLQPPSGYLNQHQLYNPSNVRPGLNPVVPSQVYNPFGVNYNRNYLPNGTINSSASSHSSN
ncbi:hypothetical protein AMK59_3242 [Oryctes borbonicus]|uniref:RanBP2-type domain-containing protein n=1 Tax=Oryctes borbonicus TaxID=1629725 RepID=A0A0T6B6I1_9SCAR|nr:hypothetical protein AMK59_3242 [Oryctes borbonicus]